MPLSLVSVMVLRDTIKPLASNETTAVVAIFVKMLPEMSAGCLDAKTEAAVRAYQTDQGVESDGMILSETEVQLGTDFGLCLCCTGRRCQQDAERGCPQQVRDLHVVSLGRAVGWRGSDA